MVIKICLHLSFYGQKRHKFQVQRLLFSLFFVRLIHRYQPLCWASFWCCRGVTYAVSCIWWGIPHRSGVISSVWRAYVAETNGQTSCTTLSSTYFTFCIFSSCHKGVCLAGSCGSGSTSTWPWKCLPGPGVSGVTLTRVLNVVEDQVYL